MPSNLNKTIEDIDQTAFHILDVRTRLENFCSLANIEIGNSVTLTIDFPDIDWFSGHTSYHALVQDLNALGFHADLTEVQAKTVEADHPADPEQTIGPHLVLSITRVNLIAAQTFHYPLLGLFRRLLKHNAETDERTSSG